MDFKDSKTYKNLQEAFAGESQARNKYTYFASKARKEGYEQIASIFEETANNEKEHAKLWYKAMNNGEINDTLTNLLDAAAGENGEWTEMYKRMAEEAKAEGYTALAYQFEAVGKIEREHENRYRALAKAMEENKVFTKDGEKVWVCRNCGHVHIGESAPKGCPVCAHPQSFFELKAENY